jgi:23S rRNA (cytidine1920-2'-O)/16S rRNA (cytidine1409-2'-O)-methyltransferase
MAGDGIRRERLDRILLERGLAPTRNRAQALILSGRVLSGTTRLVKPGVKFPCDVDLQVEPGRRYVSRGGHKLEAALGAFDLLVVDRDCVDVGASTGGFTQVLLEAGAGRVIALDVGRGQLDWSLRNDERVFPMEGVNARKLEAVALPFTPTLAVVDVSFISLELVLPPVIGRMDRSAEIDVVALVKPQFEVGRGLVGRGGVVKEPRLHRRVLQRAVAFARGESWGVAGLIVSPLTGAEGNREFLIHLRPPGDGLDPETLDRAVEAAIVSPVEREVEK